MAPMTLYYFDIPGRAETARLLLSLGKIDFVDKRFTWSEWPELKPKMPFHQVPVLEVDGKMLTQMAAIDRYCAAITGMLPKDPLQLAIAEQAYFFQEDIWQPIGPVMVLERGNSSKEEQDAAWKALLDPDGPFRQRLALMDKFLEKREGKFLAGDKLSYVDLTVFGTMSVLQSGWMSGMPKDILSGYPSLKAFRGMVAALPEVAAYYSKETDAVRVQGFRPDADDAASSLEGLKIAS